MPLVGFRIDVKKGRKAWTFAVCGYAADGAVEGFLFLVWLSTTGHETLRGVEESVARRDPASGAARVPIRPNPKLTFSELVDSGDHRRPLSLFSPIVLTSEVNKFVSPGGASWRYPFKAFPRRIRTAFAR